ncbi:hypothetical protein IscW_ISCW023209 [Ixodes scapularis]|uniref:Uncharacterized protein n=1 Tax=Ixodes scapularis TaxID=6945 RepID=B7QJ92_IXOSC|nr:hypothetical protein IscW_ISCW023209 [Ixodes scapularis]|eukprot:XP_002415249.1 hypothetical protein IscW_ISCW023209 [Ixodes scapularis]
MSVGAAATGCLSPKTTISLLGAGAPGSAGGLSADTVCGIVFGAPRHGGLEISLWMHVLRFLESGLVFDEGPSGLPGASGFLFAHVTARRLKRDEALRPSSTTAFESSPSGGDGPWSTACSGPRV